MDGERRSWRVAASAPVFSPQGMLLRALLLVFIFVLCHFLGWREYTTILCGISLSGNPGDAWASLKGVLYLLSWFGFILAAPILVISAGVFMLCLKFNARTR
ncbi:MAG TPA: hypothetical protein VGP72_20465 [Planctomycetota bacterium]|jgi:hypothetical protein